MIESIGIRNLGVIESAELELTKGFTALTGETGAGKTMVLNALNLLLGNRADSSVVRTGQQSLLVQGSWQVDDSEVISRVEDLGGMVEQGNLIVTRQVNSDGRSKAVLGGAQAPVGSLAEIAERLVTVHGQSDQLRLRTIGAQRDALDEFGSDELRLSKAVYQSTYTSYKELNARLERQRSATGSNQARIDQLRALILELEKLNPQPGELSLLDEQINRLSNVEGLQLAAATAHDALSSDENPAVLQFLATAIRALENTGDSKLGELAAKLSEAAALSSDVSQDLASFLIDLEADPNLLEQLQSRKQSLVALQRKTGLDIDQLSKIGPSWNAELLDLDSSDEQLEKLEMQIAAVESQLAQAARQLTHERKLAAELLEKAVSEELAQLAMGGSKFSISITELSDFEASGLDRVEFLLANSGSEPRPLSKGASGGELSRIMLAIELVLVASKPLPTMIFDEVDAGVGGQAALELGRRLKRLSQKTQVIVVTHLPQVAAFADNQIQVSKDASGEITTSSVRSLNRHERVIELARMLSGNPDSDLALAHAEELLNLG